MTDALRIPRPQTKLAGYAVAFVAVAGAVIARWVLDPVLGDTLPLVTLFGAVAVAVWAGGYRVAIGMALIGYFACSYLFVEPRGVIGVDGRTVAGLATYLVTCALIVGFGEAMRAAQAHAARLERDTVDQLLAARMLASIVESSELAVVSKSLEGVVQSWNAAAEALFGYSAAEAVGRHISFVIPPERLAEESQIIATLKAGRRIEHLETERLRSDGRRVLVSLAVSPIKDDDGNVIGASKIARDITRERVAEAERHRFVTLVESSTDFVGICDLLGVPIFINRAGLDMVGLDGIEDARRTNILDFFFPEDRPTISQKVFPEVLNEGHAEIEVRFRHFKTGEARWMAYKVLALTDDAGRATALATVSQDVTERRRLADNLRRLAADLSEADRRKDEFLATLSHELRGPLAPLQNVLEVWKRSSDGAEQQRARDMMERQLGQLVRLVEDLLDLNRITHNLLELRQSRAELATVIEHALETCRPLVDARRHEVRVSLPKSPVYLRADSARLAQVFANLLSNSCKYTDAGGTITVTAEERGAEVVVIVRDTGVGIPPDKLAKVFDMFTQVAGSSDRSEGGLGIGLTLVKRLVEMHGGAVEARSAGMGQGSEFVVRLPVSDAESGAASSAPAAVPRPAQRRRILVVDDNEDSAVSLSLLLQIDGNETFTAHDGLDAIAAVEKHRPDVVLLDIGLPRMNGHDVCRHLRAQAWGKALVLIALTGWGQNEDRRKSREAGFDGHLVKPVDYLELRELLSSVRLGPEAS